MTILWVIIIGGIIGWLAAMLLGRREGILMSVVIGIVGSFIGSFLASLFSGNTSTYVSFRWAGILWSFVGAIILVAIMNAFSSRSHHDRV